MKRAAANGASLADFNCELLAVAALTPGAAGGSLLGARQGRAMG
jgi:hypothetical protein